MQHTDDKDVITDEELTKELYARFSLAYYQSECLHRELCNIYASSSLKNRLGITRPRVEELLNQAYSLTLGQVVDALKEILPDSFYVELVQAVKNRNFLAHHFWFERVHLMFNTAGLLISELGKMSEQFSRLDKEASKVCKPFMENIGVTEEHIQNALAEILAGKPDDPLLKQRKLKKQERLIRAWEFSLDDRNWPLVFETDDGCLWQLCDVGLGWTGFNAIGPEWKLQKIIQAHLPAIINPRPINCNPWNYELNLANGVVFWVKPGREENTFKWGVRTS